MGTNYYTYDETNKCEYCGRGSTRVHVGKSSAGWKFSFQWNGAKFYRDIEEMKEWLKDKIIKDEYGQRISFEDFWILVEAKQDGHSHFEYVQNNHPQETKNSFTIDGYEFTDVEFS